MHRREKSAEEWGGRKVEGPRRLARSLREGVERASEAVKNVIIYTDGACKGNPGPGGWAAVLIYGSNVRELTGGAPATTNNRMELQAAIEALQALKEPCKVDLHTDSAYLRNGVTKWVEKWRACGWLTNGKVPVRNQDLWMMLENSQARHAITWHWVKGHGSNPHNIRCDRLAKLQIAEINRSHSHSDLKAHLSTFFQLHGRRKQNDI